MRYRIIGDSRTSAIKYRTFANIGFLSGLTTSLPRYFDGVKGDFVLHLLTHVTGFVFFAATAWAGVVAPHARPFVSNRFRA